MLVLRTCIGGKPGHASNNGTHVLRSTACADGGSTLHSARFFSSEFGVWQRSPRRTIPTRKPIDARLVSKAGAVRDLLAEGWKVGDGRRARLLATLKLAIDFHTWRSLERGSGLSREEAVETMLEAVRSSVLPPGAP
jgi:hypothetical protein